MLESEWLTLSEYSRKYGMSVSTLRRRIKNGQTEHAYDEGKYRLKDAPLLYHKPTAVCATPPTVPPQGMDRRINGVESPMELPVEPLVEPPIPTEVKPPGHLNPPPTRSAFGSGITDRVHNVVETQAEETAQKLDQFRTSTDDNSLVFSMANKLLNELKRAYALILQEKEEQILMLRDEMADLKTLVRVLENECERLKFKDQEISPVDSWLER